MQKCPFTRKRWATVSETKLSSDDKASPPLAELHCALTVFIFQSHVLSLFMVPPSNHGHCFTVFFRRMSWSSVPEAQYHVNSKISTGAEGWDVENPWQWAVSMWYSNCRLPRWSRRYGQSWDQSEGQKGIWLCQLLSSWSKLPTVQLDPVWRLNRMTPISSYVWA